MLLGVIDQAAGESFGPSGNAAIIVLDFKNGIYTNNGSPMTAADVVSNTGRISGSGLSIISGTPVNLLNETLALLLTGTWSVIITYAAGSAAGTTSNEAYLLTLFDVSLTYQIAMYTLAEGGGFYQTVHFESTDGGSQRNIDTFNVSNAQSSQTTKCGFRRTDASATVTVGGETPDSECKTNTVVHMADFATPLTLVQCADANASSMGFIEKIEIWPPVNDATLASLTA